MVIEKERVSLQSSRTSIREVVNECSPGGGALPSKPQAVMVSMIGFPEFPRLGAELAAAQQSRRTRTSDLALSNKP
jgi:hypothetical protein